MQKPTTVEEYIQSTPQDVQPKLRELQSFITELCPEAEEKISYGMPYYGYKGRLIYFQAWPKHIGLYLTPPIIQEFAEELQGYVTATATIQIPLDKELPLPLIKKLIKARMKLNEEREKKK